MHVPGPTARLSVGAAVAASVGIGVFAAAPPPATLGRVAITAMAMLAAVLVARRLSACDHASWRVVLAPRSGAVRLSVVGAAVFVATVVGSVCAGALARLLIAFPGALPAVLVAAASLWFAPRLGRAVAAVPVVVVLLAVVGARFEAAGPQAHGETWGGPIHGIHPFQTTAVMIDGYGPFDIAINDYVEPLGGRGYDPYALADAFELAFDRIAELHFAQGPARARQAFADAQVDAFESAPVRERLDRTPPEPSHLRLHVRSGTTGPRSRVEFVCPGRRDDPRGAMPDAITLRMCPDKYASEASAGLGVTGRWPGYAEQRGRERMGISTLLGRTRSDDDRGAAWLRSERWIWVALLLGALAWLLAREGSARTALRHAGWLAAPAVLLVAAAWLGDRAATGGGASLPPWSIAPGWLERSAPRTWLGFAVWPAVAAMAALVVPGAASTSRRGSAAPLLLGIALVLVAADVRAVAWLGPAGASADARVDAIVLALAEAASTRVPLPILELEAVVAAALGSVLVLGIALVLGAVATACGETGPVAAAPWRRRLGVLGTAALAVSLSISRKTDGGVALMPAAVGVALVLGSALQAIAARGAWSRSRVGTIPIAMHLLWTGVGLALVAHAAGWGSGDAVRWVYALFAFAATLLPLAVLARDPEPPGSPSPAPPGP
ncbi:MAG: hypothetical protein K1X88_13315 [Nannocystaceae bacterium]|nr:hypothetical protein [Nannocystaceae bacterium]